MKFVTRLTRLDAGYLAAACLPLIGVVLALSHGVPSTADGPLHVHRIYAMSTLLATGNLWPRWVPYFHVGYGYPLFNFYAPGVYHLGGYLTLVGVAPPVAFNLLTALTWVIGSTGTYHLARQFLPGRAALLAAAIWAYAPSRLFEVWDQGSLPQMMAAAWVPWHFSALVGAARQPSGRQLVVVAWSLAGIILSHQPITFITAIYALPGAVLLSLWAARGQWRSLLARLTCTMGGLALGAGLASVFLLPVAAELRYVRAVETPSDALPYLISNYLPPQQLFAQPLPMDLTDLRYELLPSFGLVGGVLSAIGFLALLRSRHYALASTLAAALAFTVFMLLEVSLPVWSSIPFFVQLRFPERFLRIGTVFLAVLAGASLLLLPRRWQSVGLLLAIAVVVAAVLPIAYANQPFVHWDALSAVDEIEMELTAHTWGSTSYNEFKPKWGRRIDYSPPPEMEAYRDAPLRLTVMRLDMIRQWPDLQVDELNDNTVSIYVRHARPVRFRQFYFPGWQATVDSAPVAVYPEPELGLLTINLPAGQHTVQLWYAGTDIQRAGAGLSLLCLVMSGYLFTQAEPTSADRRPVPPSQKLSWREAKAITAGVIGFTVLNSVYIAPHTLWFRLQSPPDAPFYLRSPVNVPFGDRFQLLGYTLDAHDVTAGSSLDITLFWRALTEIDREYRPVVQLVNLSQTEAWAVSQPFFPGGGKTVGYPTKRFASEVHRLRVIETAPPYVGRILVQMVDSLTGEPLLLPDGSAYLLLPPLIRVHSSNPSVKRNLDYVFGDSIALWCASVSRSREEYVIDLVWFVQRAVANDFTVFVHGVDAANTIVSQSDGPPLQGDYPTSLWRPGQLLPDRFTLAANDALANIRIGFYTHELGRLPITQAGHTIGDFVVLPHLEQPCTD